MNKFFKGNYMRRAIRKLTSKKICRLLDDRTYLKLKYWAFLGRKLDLKNTKYFNEKMQWIKLNYYDDRLPSMVDKYEVRKYIAKWIGDEFLVPLIGVWNKAEDIEWDLLPDKFVLKCTHGSHTNIICYNKNNLNINETTKQLDEWLNDKGTYYFGREWPYKYVQPRIIAEKLIETDDPGGIRDYKFLCFEGRPDNVMVCSNRQVGNISFDHFTRDWTLLRCQYVDGSKPENYTIEKPDQMDEMFEIAEKLSSRFHFVRVDLYCENNKIYFGELTFFPSSGFDLDYSEQGDLMFGRMIDLKKFVN